MELKKRASNVLNRWLRDIGFTEKYLLLGQSFEEIGKAVGLKPGTVEVQVGWVLSRMSDLAKDAKNSPIEIPEYMKRVSHISRLRTNEQLKFMTTHYLYMAHLLVNELEKQAKANSIRVK
jgi:hypothetical protein